MHLQYIIFLFLSLVTEAYSEKQPHCRRDFSNHCAEGWSKLLNSEECVAPLSYTGPCPRFLQAAHDTKKKKLLEKECNINWPCMTKCEIDYSAQCPSTWIPIDSVTCFPSSIYNGRCLLPQDFSIMTVEQKIIWGNMCDATWPCKEKCKKDYAKSCPQGWNKDDSGLCTAPKHYNGPCLPKASLTTMDKEMKVAFEKLCQIEFPCLRKCELDMEEACPKQWILQSDENGNAISCLPPDNYTGPCDRNTKFLSLSVESRDHKALECNVEWPCVEDEVNLISYDELCPEGWTQEEKYCIAPKEYQGPCPHKKLFTSFSKELKKEYGEICNIKWPLVEHKKLEHPKSHALRKGKYSSGAVDQATGDVISEV